MVNSLSNIFEETDSIDIHTNNVCFNCGAKLENDYTTKCSQCGYDAEELYSCPYKVQKEIQIENKPVTLSFCELSRKQCKISGLDYEICPIFRSLDSINNKE